MSIEELPDEQRKLARAIVAGVRERLKHDCAFDSEERKILHEYIDSAKKENADSETLVIVFRIGNNIRDGAKNFMKWFVWVFMFIAAFVFYHMTVKHWLGKP